MKDRRFRVGTRASLLARTQTAWVCREISRRCGARFTEVLVRTLGDKVKGSEVFGADRTGVFTKAIERKLASGAVDLAVHSLKDLPTELTRGLALAAFPKREDPSDVLISKRRYSLRSLPQGSTVGTGSPRRRAQLLRLRPDLRVKDLRGNLDTRVRKALERDGFDAVVVALAGLRRLGKYLRYAKTMPPNVFLPAVGQGALAVQTRRDDGLVHLAVSSLNHRPTELAVRAERAFLRTLRGGCRVPVGAYAALRGSRLTLHGAVYSTRSAASLRGKLTGASAEPEKIGVALAKSLLKRGAGRYLTAARTGADR